MKTIIHPSDSRGHADHGWLDAHHSFSFADWHDPSRIHFGLLRVLNDDIVEGGKGFGMHPHNDMEIITIILEGALQHRDNMGNGSVIKPGDVQVMSAGTGVMHSEFNPSPDQRTNLYQLWIFPKEKGIKPRYDQKTFSPDGYKNKVQLVASGFKRGEELYIHQDAAISLVELDAGREIKYDFHKPANGVYVMVTSGEVEIADEKLGRRDAIGISETSNVPIRSIQNSRLLIIEVPMN